jgi:2-dehydro-3-deoxygluconokinase
MVLATPSQSGRLRHAPGLELRIGGAESNVAIALSRLGVSSSWISRLGEGEPGSIVLDKVRAEGVDTSRVGVIEGRPTGLYLRERVGSQTQVYYYRQGSAASTLAPEAFGPEFLEGVGFLHLTGITPALSGSCREFTLWATQRAREAGVRVSFDVNYRSKLWPAKLAREFVDEVLPEVDLLFVGAEEARALWGRDDEKFARELAGDGEREIVLKRGRHGSAVVIGGELVEHPPFEVAEVDPIGAGDAFAAGYLAGHLWGRGPYERGRVANAMGAYSVMTLGDYEGLPGRAELERFLSGAEEMGR